MKSAALEVPPVALRLPTAVVETPPVARRLPGAALGKRAILGMSPAALRTSPRTRRDAVRTRRGGGRGVRSRRGGHRVPLTSPRVSAGGGRLLSERDLLRVAQLLGHEWQEVGVLCLGLRRCLLEQIRENNPHRTALCSFEMLREWRRREGAAATAPRLSDCLRPARLDPEVFALLQQL